MTPSLAPSLSSASQASALQRFAEREAGAAMSKPEPMTGGGSARRYYRMRSLAPAPWGDTVVGVIAPNPAEARAFVGLTRHLAATGIPVPRLFASDKQGCMYLVEDLGDLRLSDRLREWRSEGDAGLAKAQSALHTTVRWLARLQVRGGKGMDWTLCFEGTELSGEAFRADLRLFLEHYVPRFVDRPGPDATILADLERLIERLDGLPRQHLCHRDFQARNIMWPHGGPVFLDYQGCRRGPLAYDLASLLYSPDSGLTEAEREPVMIAYLQALEEEGVRQEPDTFRRDFYAVVLVRRLQALGAYARIAAVESKPDYLAKIPSALATLRELIQADRISLGLPALEHWLLGGLATDAYPRSLMR